MARARAALAQAVNTILDKHGIAGKRLSLRQAERLTGLAPATIGELAKGNARTPETVRRFAQGMNENTEHLMLLAGFVPEERDLPLPSLSPPPLLSAAEGANFGEVEPEMQAWLGRLGRALAKMPPGRERELWKDSLRRDTELIESFLERLAPDNRGSGEERDGV